MKVAYLTAQSKTDDLDNPILSYAAVKTQVWEPASENVSTLIPKDESDINIFKAKDVDGLFELLRTVNLIVLFGIDFHNDILHPYHKADLYIDYGIFDIADMLHGELEYYVKHDTIAKSVGLSRLVTSGMSYIQWWKDGKVGLISRGMKRDVEIIQKAFKQIMMCKQWKLDHPFTDEYVLLDIQLWRDVAREKSLLPFNTRVDSMVKRYKNIAENTGDGLEHLWDCSINNFCLDKGLLESYVNSKGKTVIFHPSITVDDMPLGE